MSNIPFVDVSAILSQSNHTPVSSIPESPSQTTSPRSSSSPSQQPSEFPESTSPPKSVRANASVGSLKKRKGYVKISSEISRKLIGFHFACGEIKNEKQGTKAGTNKRKQIIEYIDDDEYVSDDVVENEIVPLNESESLLDRMENEDLESQVGSNDIQSASDFRDFREKEQSKVQERNATIQSKRMEKEEMVARVRAQEERREKMDELRTAMMASCMNYLDSKKNESLEQRVISLESNFHQGLFGRSEGAPALTDRSKSLIEVSISLSFNLHE